MKTKPLTQHGIRIHNAGEARAVIRALDVSRKAAALTVTGAIELWCDWLRKNATDRTLDNTQTYIRAWARDMKLGIKPLAAIEEEHVNEWINAPDGTKLSTRRVRLSIVRSFFRFLSIKELLSKPDPSRLARIKVNQLTHRQKETKDVATFTEQEFMKLIDHLEERLEEVQAQYTAAKSKALADKLQKRRDFLLFWRPAIIIGRCAGLRLGDICQLEWDCFGKHFAVWTDKRDKRVQPWLWNKELFEEAIAQIPVDDTTYCFPAARLLHRDGKKRGKLSMQFTRLCDRLGMKGRSYHGLRHTYATECAASGIPTPHIARSLGHSRTSTTEDYIHD